MFSNSVFKWLALILIVYILINNRGMFTNNSNLTTPSTNVSQNIIEEAKKLEGSSEPEKTPEQKLLESLTIPDNTTNNRDGESQAVTPNNRPLNKEEEELLQQVIKLKEVAEKTKELAPVDPNNASRKKSRMFSDQDLSLMDFSVNAKKRSGMLIEDVIRGKNSPVFCGSSVKLHYKLNDPDGNEVYSSRSLGEPLTVKIGGGEIIKGLENGIIGMKAGGIRKITIPANYAFDDPKFKGKGPENLKMIAEVELQEIINPLKNSSKMPLRIFDDITPNYSGGILEVVCGQEVSVNYALWNMKGELIATSVADDKTEKSPGKSKLKTQISMPLTFKLGSGEVPLALEAAVSGNEDVGTLRIGGKRTLIIPPDYLKTLSGKPLDKKIFDGAKIPQNEAVILEVELLKVEGKEMPKVRF